MSLRPILDNERVRVMLTFSGSVIGWLGLKLLGSVIGWFGVRVMFTFWVRC